MTTTTKRRGLKPRRWIALAFVVLAAGTACLIAGLAPATSGRAAVASAMAALGSGDSQAFQKAVRHDAELKPFFDVIGPLTFIEMREFVGTCAQSAMTSGLDTVSIRFNCARDARNSFIVDFRICEGKIQEVSWPEPGRVFLTPRPLFEDLIERAVGLSPCRSFQSQHIVPLGPIVDD